MRRSNPDISIRSEIGFEDDLMRRVIEGTVDVALMYTQPGQYLFVICHALRDCMIFVMDRNR